MTIILFLIDTSSSMNQRTYLGARPTLLDVAKDAVEKLQEVFIEEMPFTMLYQNQYVHAFRNDLQGFKFHPVWFVDLFELHK